MAEPRKTRRFVQAMEAIGATALLALMLIVFIDVAGRNLINKPLPWGTELLEMILAVMIFAVYPLLALAYGHITVDLIQVRPSLHVAQRVLASAMGAVVFAVIAFCMGRQVIRAAGYGEATPLLGVPLSWIIGGVGVMAAVCVLAFVVAVTQARKADAAAPFSTEVI